MNFLRRRFLISFNSGKSLISKKSGGETVSPPVLESRQALPSPRTPLYNFPPVPDHDEYEDIPGSGQSPSGTHAPSALERAAAHLRGSLRADGPDGGGAAGLWSYLLSLAEREESERERESGGGDPGTLSVWRGASAFPPPDRCGGAEHDVRYDPDTRRWWKYTKPDASGLAVTWEAAAPPVLHNASPLEYMARLQAQNELFGDDIRLEGLWRQGRGWRIITSQPHADGEPPTREEIHAALTADGWLPAPQWNGLGYEHGLTFLRGDWLLADAHPANFVKTADGALIPIDVILTRWIPATS